MHVDTSFVDQQSLHSFTLGRRYRLLTLEEVLWLQEVVQQYPCFNVHVIEIGEDLWIEDNELQ